MTTNSIHTINYNMCNLIMENCSICKRASSFHLRLCDRQEGSMVCIRRDLAEKNSTTDGRCSRVEVRVFDSQVHGVVQLNMMDIMTPTVSNTMTFCESCLRNPNYKMEVGRIRGLSNRPFV